MYTASMNFFAPKFHRSAIFNTPQRSHSQMTHDKATSLHALWTCSNTNWKYRLL